MKRIREKSYCEFRDAVFLRNSSIRPETFPPLLRTIEEKSDFKVVLMDAPSTTTSRTLYFVPFVPIRQLTRIDLAPPVRSITEKTVTICSFSLRLFSTFKASPA